MLSGELSDPDVLEFLLRTDPAFAAKYDDSYAAKMAC